MIIKRILNIIVFTILLIISFWVGVVVDKGDFYTRLKYEPINVSNCSNLSVEETSYCLRNYVEPFYNYNENNTGKELTLEELKEQGGVCWHYSRLYEQSAKELGFNSRAITFWNNNHSIGHMVALVYDENLTEYCILDQMEVGCVALV